MSVDDIAAHLGVRRDTVYKWINRRHMPAHKVGRLWKLRKQEVDQWVRSKNAQVSRLENRVSDGTLGERADQKREM